MRILIFILFLCFFLLGCTYSGTNKANDKAGINQGVKENINSAKNKSIIPAGYEIKDYCRENNDCVRLNTCCYCGLGIYVNIYNQQNTSCSGPRCMCPIARSKGICINNKCMAVESIKNYSQVDSLDFITSTPECGDPVLPQRHNTDEGVYLNGFLDIGTNGCMANVTATISRQDSLDTINITQNPGPNGILCMHCNDNKKWHLKWQTRIQGYYERVEIYYNNKKIFPDIANYCGISTNGKCNSNKDCIKSGCSGQICGSKFEVPVITACEWKACYSNYHGVDCGCINNACHWY